MLESGDRKLLDTINESEYVMQMVREISEKSVESGDEGEGSEDGEGEVVALARRCLEIASGEAEPSSRDSEGDYASSYKT